MEGARGESVRFSSPNAALDPGAEEPASGGQGGVRGERAGPSSAQVVTAAVLEGQENIIQVLKDINNSIKELTNSVAGAGRVRSIIKKKRFSVLKVVQSVLFLIELLAIVSLPFAVLCQWKP